MTDASLVTGLYVLLAWWRKHQLLYGNRSKGKKSPKHFDSGAPKHAAG
jgi:hypothetical protein